MKKTGAYITTYNMQDEQMAASGIAKKIGSQFEVMNSFFNMKWVIISIKEDSFVRKIWRRLPFTPSSAVWDYDKELNDVDFVYIRKDSFDRKFTLFLKKLRRENPKVKIMIEIPTFPYDGEFRKPRDYPQILKDRYCRKRLHKYVDRIVTLSKDQEVFEVKTICMINGIDVDKINCLAADKYDDEKTIDLIAVATMERWHGFDRLITGMGEYYKNGGTRNIMLRMVGDGNVVSEYKHLVENYGIGNHVIFYGKKFGKELDVLYNKSDIGVEVFALHRKMMDLSSSLKSREYCAKGLPQIAACDIDMFINKDFKCFCRFPADESPIDILKLIDFYDAIYNNNSRKAIIQDIRQFAYENCDMKKTMLPVIEYVEEREQKSLDDRN